VTIIYPVIITNNSNKYVFGNGTSPKTLPISVNGITTPIIDIISVKENKTAEGLLSIRGILPVLII
jgi:hypothetical protein